MFCPMAIDAADILFGKKKIYIYILLNVSVIYYIFLKKSVNKFGRNKIIDGFCQRDRYLILSIHMYYV